MGSIHGDVDLLTPLLANLIENAIRHCPPGTHIVDGASVDRQTVRISVSDTGPGIRPEEHDKVFRRLSRVERSRTTTGSGLGLTLVRAISDLHGAQIVLSDNQPGLNVELRFPVVHA